MICRSAYGCSASYTGAAEARSFNAAHTRALAARVMSQSGACRGSEDTCGKVAGHSMAASSSRPMPARRSACQMRDLNGPVATNRRTTASTSTKPVPVRSARSAEKTM